MIPAKAVPRTWKKPGIRLSILFLTLVSACSVASGTAVTPAPQQFRQELAISFTSADGLPVGAVQLIDCGDGTQCRAFAGGMWYALRQGRWEAVAELAPAEGAFAFAGSKGEPVRCPVPWQQVRQVLRLGEITLVTGRDRVIILTKGETRDLSWRGADVNQAALSPEGDVYVASAKGLWRRGGGSWEALEAMDRDGRVWTAGEVRGVAVDGGRLWVATRAGVALRESQTWTFFDGKDGLPYNDFTCVVPGRNGEVWFGTHMGAIRFDGKNWHYRQGHRWLPNDDILQLTVDPEGSAWFATAGGVGHIGRRDMTLAQKAELYESEIEKYIKRTPFGYVAEAPLKRQADRSTANPQDSDNDGLWTAMYGAGECFAYAATKDLAAKTRATKAFEALRFLQKVTQGGAPAPPKGYVARTIRPIDWPDPNPGRLAGDHQAQKGDKLWKAYEPRWPRSADGKWFWKSDTSSDELDGHFFFYPLYYDLVAQTDAERGRVREVVRDLADHLVTHGFTLTDHDGKPTRWAIYGPQFLNRDPFWWVERGLNSLSILAYLSVAEHVTGDQKYSKASRDLVDNHGYGQNLMYPKAQRGPGSGNQSDDEMAFMCYYTLLHCSKDESLKSRVRTSFYHYWVNEAPELNPFFNFAYAAHSLGKSCVTPYGDLDVSPWDGWHKDAMATLYGFSLDRLNWGHRNSQRIDLVPLPAAATQDLDQPEPNRARGYRVNGKVLPVENRFFNHWNTDPWALDYGGNGNELGAGTVFLLPYYMGLYHGFIARPVK
jgi:hypothetical protein